MFYPNVQDMGYTPMAVITLLNISTWMCVLPQCTRYGVYAYGCQIRGTEGVVQDVQTEIGNGLGEVKHPCVVKDLLPYVS